MDSEVTARSSIERWRSIPWRQVAVACLGVVAVAAIVVLTEPPVVLAAFLIGASAALPASIVVLPLAERIVMVRLSRSLESPDTLSLATRLSFERTPSLWQVTAPRLDRTRRTPGIHRGFGVSEPAEPKEAPIQGGQLFAVHLLADFVEVRDSMTRDELIETQAVVSLLHDEISKDLQPSASPAGYDPEFSESVAAINAKLSAPELSKALDAINAKLSELQAQLGVEAETNPQERQRH
jgi:hypothetical protein